MKLRCHRAIDNPDVLGIISPVRPLFADESVVWVGALKVVDQLAFGGQVDLSDSSFAFASKRKRTGQTPEQSGCLLFLLRGARC